MLWCLGEADDREKLLSQTWACFPVHSKAHILILS